MPRVPPAGRRFEKGNNANPRGAGAHNQALKRLKRLTREQIEEISAILLEKKPHKLQDLLKNKKLNTVQAMVASVAIKAIIKGDANAMEKLFKETAGPQRQEIDITGNLPPAQVILTLPRNGREAPEDEEN